MVGAGKGDGKLNRSRIEVHGVEIEFLQIRRWWTGDVLAAFGKSFVASVEPLAKIRNGAAEMAQHPADARKSFGDAAEHQAGRRERRIHQEADQRHEPVIEHGFHAYRIRGVYVEDGAQLVGRFVELPETLVAEGNAIDVREDHGAAEV